MAGEKEAKEHRLRVQYDYSRDTPYAYANHFRVSHTPFEFTLDFFHITPEDTDASVDTGEPITLHPSIRISMPPEIIKAVIDTLEANLKKYEGKFGKAERRGLTVRGDMQDEADSS